MVYEGTWSTPVAVKVLHPLLIEPGVDGRQSFIAKFEKECDRLRQLRHDNIVTFLGVHTTEDGALALVTERMEGTLMERYECEALALDKQLDYLCDTSFGLSYLHCRGVIHRDLTTRNVLISAHDQAKLSDVGVSQSLHGDTFGAGMTRCPGTLVYMSPEALAERPSYDEKLDCFSFGVLAMALISRREPAQSLLFNQPLVERLQHGSQRTIPEVERRRAYLDHVPGDHPVRPLILRCLSNDPGMRPSANEELSVIRRNVQPNVQSSQ